MAEKKHKVIIVGLDNAGKTTILYQFSMNEVVHTSPTIGSNVEEIVINNTRFLMWDIGGQESLRSSWNTYYTNTEFVIVVVDSTDRERISVTREELYKMLAHEDLRKAGLLIFANKQDVKGCMTVAEISQFLKLTSIKDHQWHIQACCALTGEGFHIWNILFLVEDFQCGEIISDCDRGSGEGSREGQENLYEKTFASKQDSGT
ncbi:hypothetical protein E5288_WYG008815 [Bos mutus]|uniref:ADP-ribosylation factor-like protein 5A n=1 Tax=Bos mutus TaxID=72004 RepID=A0A6B0RKS5_9CETA|nr:hypothetical protein [Bos mutus]